jgi:hypothetical protein
MVLNLVPQTDWKGQIVRSSFVQGAVGPLEARSGLPPLATDLGRPLVTCVWSSGRC